MILDKTNIKPTKFLLFLIFLTSSFDIYLNFDVGGFSLRTVLILIILYCVFTLIYFNNKIAIHFIGKEFFFIWFSIVSLFFFNTSLLNRNFAYLFWMLIYIIFIVCLSMYKPNRVDYYTIIKIYIISFKILAIFGILQLLLSYLGINLYVRDWIGVFKFPRISGFSYEPSYFSTYLMIGWSICLFIYRKKNKTLNKSLKITQSLLIITICLLLTTSRMSIFLMIILLLFPYISNILSGILRLKLNYKSLIILSIFIVSISTTILINWQKIKFFFEGLGVGGTTTNSSSNRINELSNTIEIFLKSPFIGYSLGGIPPAIANLNGIVLTNQAQTKAFEGMNIFAELLAASGIIGFLFFVLFLLNIYLTKSTIKKIILDENLKTIYIALLYALLVEFILLSMNQNILRAYLWIHIAVINFSYFSIKHLNEKSN